MLRTAFILLAITVAYNVVEGGIAVASAADAGSIALLAFGIDSYLEVAAAGVVIWRLRLTDPEEGERGERTAMRFIGWTFLVLAAGVAFQSGWALVGRDGAEESVVGIGLAIASVVAMPALALGKLRVAARQGIPVLAQEAKETLACWYLSATLFLGLLANALWGAWWLDATTALLLVPWLVREGLEGVRGEDEEGEERRLCSCRACLYGLRGCAAPCCVT